MIVIGVDVHKQSMTAVAVDEAGRMLDERTVLGVDDGLVTWASQVSSERLWAIEDCRQLTRTLERELILAGEDLVRVPPKLMAPERRAGRRRGKSDPIDALAVARAALREPRLSRPRPDDQPFRELKLLVDHRDDLVDERRRIQQRLRWHLHQLDPTFVIVAKGLDRPVHLDRVGRWLNRRPAEVQARVAREPVVPRPSPPSGSPTGRGHAVPPGSSPPPLLPASTLATPSPRQPSLRRVCTRTAPAPAHHVRRDDGVRERGT